MGQREQANRATGNLLESDFTETTKSLNFISKTLGINALRLGFALLALEQILNDTKDIAKHMIIRIERHAKA
jgi:plasmid maintenance system antidote protein VapI